MNLLLLEPGEVGDGGEISLGGARAAHLLNVLRVTPGQTVRIGVLDGPLESARSAASPRRVSRSVARSRQPFRRVRRWTCCSRSAAESDGRLWAQIAAMGVGHIILTNAGRVERNYFDTHVLTPECYRPPLVEGLQQARDTRLPRVTILGEFKVLVEDDYRLFPDGLRLVADLRRRHCPRRRRRRGRGRTRPAGSRARRRLERVRDAGCSPRAGLRTVSIGPRTLRTDTACIALLALIHDALGATS